MARPATGSPRWNPNTNQWEARITINGQGRKPHPLPTVPPCVKGTPLNHPAGEVECASCQQARRVASLLSSRMRNEGRVPGDEAETVSEWFERYYAWRKVRGRGAESLSDSRGRFKNWIEPRLGTYAMCVVTRDDLERFAGWLDEQVAEDTISASTAGNIWGEITAGFGVATKGKNQFGKNLDLRILDSNPAQTAAGPDGGTDKEKPFLRPSEVTALLTCGGVDGVPLVRRHVYAVAIYTAMRQSELRALRVRDVDFDAMQITVARQAKSGKEKDRTKTGRARIVQIEPNLLPLLRVLVGGKGPDDRLLWVTAHNRCASHLREDLITAGCTRDALHVPKSDAMRVHMKFHNLRDTCLTHMAVRRDPVQDVQWRAGHTTPAMTEAYIASARYAAGANFGAPLGPLPGCLLHATEDVSRRGRPPTGPRPGARRATGARSGSARRLPAETVTTTLRTEVGESAVLPANVAVSAVAFRRLAETSIPGASTN